MGSVEIKAIVRDALNVQWDSFAARHPALAAAIDQELLAETCMRDLRDDAEFQEATRALETAPLFAPIVQETIARIVKAWLLRM